MVIIKSNLKELRIKRGFSQSSLAEAVGTTRKTIYAIETENQDIHISLAQKLAMHLGCSIDDLYAIESGMHTTVDKAVWFVHVVRYVADAIGKPVRETVKLLEQRGLAKRILSGYDVWHTQGYEYMAEVLSDELSTE